MFNFDGQEDDQAEYDLSPKDLGHTLPGHLISLVGCFLVVIVTPNPCPRHVCDKGNPC